jgi:hypothetical protein
VRHGTALAALRDKDEIAIAADSRVLDGMGLRLPDGCKIRVYNDTIAAVHGIAENETTTFDLFALASKAIAAGGDLTTVAQRLANAAAAPLARAIADMQDTDPLLLQNFGLGTNPAGIVLARHESGGPKLAYVRFLLKKSTDLVVQADLQVCPGQCPTGALAVLVSPDPNAATGFDLWHPEYWKLPLGPQVADFVKTQAQGLLANVGPPVDVIQLAHGRITWTARKDSCREKE